MKNILMNRPASRPSSGGWGNKKVIFPAVIGRPGANRLSDSGFVLIGQFK